MTRPGDWPISENTSRRSTWLRRRWAARSLLAAAAVVVLAIASSGGFVVFRLVDGPPVSGAVWSIPIHSDPAAHATGAWLLEQKVARGRAGGVVAYDQDDGRPAWRVSVPGLRPAVCEMSTTTRAGVGAMTYGTGGRCDTVMAVDVRSGKRLWHRRVAEGKKRVDDRDAPAVAGRGTVVVHQGSGAVAYGRGGKRRWSFHTRCPIKDIAADNRRVLILTGCSDGSLRLQALRPPTGKVRASSRLPTPGYATARLLHTTPTVVAAETNGLALLVLTRRGDIRARMPYRRTFDQAHLGGTDSRRSLPVTVHGGTLVATTSAVDAAPKIAAFDLATGKRKWVRTFGPNRAVTLAQEASEGAFVAFAGGTDETPPRLLLLAADDGSVSVASTYPSSLRGLAVEARLHATANRLIFVSEEGVIGSGPDDDPRGIVAVARPPAGD